MSLFHTHQLAAAAIEKKNKALKDDSQFALSPTKHTASLVKIAD